MINKSSLKLFVILFSFFGFALFGCSVPVVNKAPLDKAINSVVDEDPKELEQDIAEADKVIRDHFEAYNKQDMVKIMSTLDDYRGGPTLKEGSQYEKNWQIQFEKNKKREIWYIGYPGRYTKNNTPSGDYVDFINLYVIFYETSSSEEGTVIDMDYVLTKKTKEGPWLIHDWGV